MQHDQIAVDMLDTPGQTIVLEVERSPEAIVRDGADKTFSAEAVEGAAFRVHQWMLSRIARVKGKAAHKMEVEVTVKLDGEPLDPLTLPFRLTFVDGESRSRAIRRHDG